MLAEFLAKLREYAGDGAFDLQDGRRVFGRQTFNPPLPEEQSYPTITVGSLSGFIESVAAAVQNEAPEMVICEAQRVFLVGPCRPMTRGRDTLRAAIYVPNPCKVGEFQMLEDFRLQLMTHFVPSEGRDGLLKFLSSVVDENMTTYSDDGISQMVSVRSGVASVAQVAAPSVVTLRRIRSFSDVEHVESQYVLRMRKGTGGPVVALIEVESGWRQRQASVVAERVREGLSEKDIDIPVVW